MADTAGPRRRLARAAEARGFPTDAGTLDRFVVYLEAVLAVGRDVNLTAARTLDEAVDVLALSALAVVRAWEAPRPPRQAVDLGTGNGLPGVAVALAWPTSGVLLVERRAKKAAAVARCLDAAKIPNAAVEGCDARELLRRRPALAGAVDLVTARAVGPLAGVTRQASAWLAPGGRLAQWKGEGLDAAEREAGGRAARAGGLEVLEEIEFADAAGPAHLVLYERPVAA